MRHLVAVYGSLMKGLHNNHVMDYAEGEFVCEDTITLDAKLHSLGSYPALEIGGNDTIDLKVEVYSVTDRGLHYNLDRLEGYPTFYNRTLHETKVGNAWLYHIERDDYLDEENIIGHGDWKKYLEENVYGGRRSTGARSVQEN